MRCSPAQGRLTCWTPGPQLVALFWEVMETSGLRVQLKKGARVLSSLDPGPCTFASQFFLLVLPKCMGQGLNPQIQWAKRPSWFFKLFFSRVCDIHTKVKCRDAPPVSFCQLWKPGRSVGPTKCLAIFLTGNPFLVYWYSRWVCVDSIRRLQCGGHGGVRCE